MYFNRFYKINSTFNNLSLHFRRFLRTQNVNKVDLYFQRARLIDSIRVALRSNSSDNLIPHLKNPTLDSFVVTNALQSAPSPDSALSLIENLKTIPHFAHTHNTLYALAKVLAKARETAKLQALINAINSGKFINVARVSYMDQMRWYAISKEFNEVVRVWDEWRTTLQKHPCTESYNIVMGLCVQLGKDSDAVRVFHRMIEEGALPNCRTYTILIEHLVRSRKLDLAIELFHMLPHVRMKRTLKQYSVLVEAFSIANQLDVVKILLDQMKSDGILPGRAMLWSLQQMQDAGYDAETNELLWDMLPDGRIKKIGYSMDSSEDDNDDEDEDKESDCNHTNAVDQPHLKPWLDPASLANALQNWGAEEVSALVDAKLVWTTRLVCKMIRSFKSAETAWQFFCWVACQPGFTHDIYTVSRMITRLARQGCVDLVDQLLSKVEREGIQFSFNTIRLIIDFYGISGNGDPALRVFKSIKTICGPISKSSQLLLYSSLLRTLVKCNMNLDALNILEEMSLLGIVPDLQTYSGLMNYFALHGDIKTVQRLFGMVRQSGIEPDAYMYKVLIHAYCKCERAALALRVFEDMRNSGLLPDANTKHLLVKSLWKEGKLREAASVEERTEEISDALPLALPGHMFTVSSEDLSRVYNIYSNSFQSTCS
ncbi:pentatricopeptide repeat-containing protein At5g66631 [Nicotiana tomentosiformis]|uniref:pentatricopeptide repeat-containing protein At5g66631 n=1 Tax=Nicotiana tomentosiformis TaxID=4098 RepID=UPI00051C0B21|nr:pentatricopeptide repeat-containing protein At5g66631 [Nicotiana tomentosiformis]XP_016500741.1 PREDICTED: pentatricopeptide repeat-containing protein At5g66631-like [Nicotiana tabacum]